jgi:hypothetical protein
MDTSSAQSSTRTRGRSRRAASPAAAKAARAGSSRGAAPAEAWITDPGALLEALARAEAGVERTTPVAGTTHDEEPAAAVDPVCDPEPVCEPEAPLEAPPVLRADERIGHASNAGVIVIIRRRRAA